MSFTCISKLLLPQSLSLKHCWMHECMYVWMDGWMDERAGGTAQRPAMEAHLFPVSLMRTFLCGSYIWRALINIRIVYFWNELLIAVHDLVVLNIFYFYPYFLLKYTSQNWFRIYCIYIISAWVEIENLKDCVR